jgi:acyl-CoA thioester hydrolase
MEHHLAVRIYYEDTDAGGIVYYANYLRYLERARTEVLRQFGCSQQELLGKGVGFVVRSAQLDYRLPARLDDLVEVVTRISEVGRAQIFFSQCIERDGQRLLDATIRVACIDPASGRPIGIPRDLRETLSTLLVPSS